MASNLQINETSHYSFTRPSRVKHENKMTPQEKAKEIFDNMKGFRVTNAHRKKCSLKCCQEVMRVIHKYHIHSDCSEDASIEYWAKVKDEVEKL
jgi:hypothetical protein